MDFDWDWLLILGEFGLTFGFYRWWKSKEIFVDVLEAAPDLDIENFKKWQSPIEFASVHGIIRNDVQECLTSQYTPHTKGVIKQITIREFKSEKFKNIWTQTKNVLSDVVRQVPMRLTSPSGKYVRIEQPLAFDSITDELEVTHCKFEPYATSGIQAIIQGLFGQVSTGIETKESMLLLDRPLTGVGRLEKRGQHWNLLLNDKYGGILTRLSKKEIIDQHRSSSKVIKFFTYVFGLCTVFTITYLTYKRYKRYRRRSRLSETAPLQNGTRTILPSNLPEYDVPISDDNDSRYKCIVCLTNEIVYIMQPCSHLGLCLSCARHLQEQGQDQCPICRQDIQNYHRVYMA